MNVLDQLLFGYIASIMTPIHFLIVENSQVIGSATTSTGAPFHQECIIFLHIREERQELKIYKVEEFIDTAFSRDFLAAERLRRIETRAVGLNSKEMADKTILAKM